MVNPRIDPPRGARNVRIFWALSACILVSSCGIGERTDDIGEGYLTEGGWDPFDGRRVDVANSASEFDTVDLDMTDAAPGEIAAKLEKTAGASSASAKQLEEYFKKGDYKKGMSGAKSLRSKSAPGTTDRDVAEFIIGASNYYLGNFQEAQGMLDTHVANYPNSRHRESALYYQASNHVRLRQWSLGARLLANYINQYPQSLLMEFALFDRAMCEFSQGNYDTCLKSVNELGEKFIYSKIRDRGLTLKGDALHKKGDLAGAQQSYAEARKAAVELKHPDLEARCLANLTAVAAERGKNTEAVQYYKEFFKSHGKSSYASRAALGGLPALQATGDLDSGLRNLEGVLQEMPQNTDASVMNDALVDYAKYYREANGPDNLLRQLGNLSSDSKGSKRFKEQLLIARLEALETYFPDRKGEIRVFYSQMRSRFQPRDLSAANVLKMGDHIAATDAAESVKWYQEVLDRNVTLHKAKATIGLAKANAQLGKDVEAEKGFRAVLEKFGSPEEAEEATLGMARIASKRKDWSGAAYYWNSYLDNKGWTIARNEAQDGLAESKGHGGVAKAPARNDGTLPVKAAPSDPIDVEVTMAERMVDNGDSKGAYSTLDRLLKRYQGKELPKSSKLPYRRAQMLHEDLEIELGL